MTMLKAPRLILLAVLATATLGSTACAEGYYGNRYPQQYPGGRVDDRAYRDGYDRGRAAGIDDARRGRSFDYNRHGEYRNVRGGRNSNDYAYAFRQGFAAGYDEGYRRYAGSNQYPRSGRDVYRDGRDPRYGGSAVYRSPAAQNGYRDGYEAGRNDGRDGDRYNPVGAKRYREGDHDYNSRYGSRDAYKREYRAGFEQGYEQGYREVRRR
jgi:hypothetical protein